MAGQSARGGGTTGTYTPTVANIANVASVSVSGTFKWSRNGDMVVVSGALSVDPTTTATDTSLSLTLPIASNLATASDCAGSGSGGISALNESWAVYGDTTNDYALVRGLCQSAASHNVMVIFQYRVI